MEGLTYSPISLDDFEPYAEFLADRECTRYLLVPVIHLILPENAASVAVATKLGAEHERDTEILGGPVAICVARTP